METLAEENFVDISVHDRKDSYETVPLALALEIAVRADRAVSDVRELSEKALALKQTKIFDVSLFDRIERISISEKMLIALVFNHQVTIDYFKTRIMLLLKGTSYMMTLMECIIELLKKRTVMVII